MSIDFRNAVLAMAGELPNARVSTIVRLALAIEGDPAPSLDDADALGQWAKRQPTVAAALAADKKIHAIKELRALTLCSLLQAKSAIDILAVTR